MKELITKLKFDAIAAELTECDKVFYCAPGITKEAADVFSSLAMNETKVYVVCDLDEQNDYRGLNEIKELNRLFELNNIEIKNSNGINVSFISNLKDFNYFIFPVSKIFKNDPNGYNAVGFNGLLALDLFAQFFPEVVKVQPDQFTKVMSMQKETELNELIDKNALFTQGQKPLNVEQITIEQINQIQKAVKEFPPEQPDLQRRVNFIKTYIQVVDLKFNGANWQTVRVTIPQKLIPFKNEVLKKNLDSRLKIFSENIIDESFESFNELKSQIDDLRKEYLFRSKLRDKSIIKLNEKPEFEKSVKDFQQKIIVFKDTLFKLVKSQITDSTERIRTELINFYRENPDDTMKEYKLSFHDIVEDEVDNLMKKIHFPKVNDIIGEMELTLNFLNFTSEDFEDEKFLAELASWEKLSPDEYFKLFEKHKGFEIQQK